MTLEKKHNILSKIMGFMILFTIIYFFVMLAFLKSDLARPWLVGFFLLHVAVTLVVANMADNCEIELDKKKSETNKIL